jgi:hypothetical protein
MELAYVGAVHMPPSDHGAPVARKTLSVRLIQTDWKRIKGYAVEIETTTQDLLVAGLNAILDQRGLPLLDTPTTVPIKKKPKRSGAT